LSKGDPLTSPAHEPKGPQGKSDYYGGGQKIEDSSMAKGDPMMSPTPDPKGP